jgi:hypothetical protein
MLTKHYSLSFSFNFEFYNNDCIYKQSFYHLEKYQNILFFLLNFVSDNSYEKN